MKRDVKRNRDENQGICGEASALLVTFIAAMTSRVGTASCVTETKYLNELNRGKSSRRDMPASATLPAAAAADPPSMLCVPSAGDAVKRPTADVRISANALWVVAQVMEHISAARVAGNTRHGSMPG